MAAFGGPVAQQEGGGGWGTGQILGLRPLWEIVPPERIRSPARQDIQSGSDAEERIWSGSDRVPDFLIRWGQIDCEFSELSDGEIRPVKKSDQLFLPRLAEDDAVGG